jgi:hypothetical protein
MEKKGITRVAVKGKDRIVVDNSTGEVLELSDVAEVKRFDSLPFIKVYTEGIMALMGLNTSGLKVWGYVALNLRKHQERFYLPIELCRESVGYKSCRDIYKGLNELLRANMVIDNGDGSYSINPNMFYNGKRIK